MAQLKLIGPGTWQIKVCARVPGKTYPISRQEQFRGTKSEAQTRLSEILRSLKETPPSGSLTVEQSKISTFSDAVSLYRENLRIADRLSISHARKIDFLNRDLGAVSIDEFPGRFKTWLHHYRSTPTRHGKKRSAASPNRMIEVAKAVYNHLIALGEAEGIPNRIEINPISKVSFPKAKECARDVVLSELEKVRLLNVIDREAPHLSAIVRFALAVPCRKSELVNMRRGDLDLINSSIRLHNGTTKNDVGCWKPIPPDMLPYFRNLPAETEYLFYRQERDGGYVGLGDFKRAWRRCLKLAGLSGLKFHSTRHISATALVNNGTPEQVVLQVAGWKTNMLRNYYHMTGARSAELVRFTPSKNPPVSAVSQM